MFEMNAFPGHCKAFPLFRMHSAGQISINIQSDQSIILDLFSYEGLWLKEKLWLLPVMMSLPDVLADPNWFLATHV